MAKFLFTWELGGGLGHLMRIRPVALELVRRGHQATASIKELTHAEMVFAGTSIKYCKAPPIPRRPLPFPAPCTFAHMLANNAFRHPTDLAALMSLWRAVFDVEQPDVIVCEHSPGAMLASCVHKAKRVAMGTGFCVPAACPQFPDWRPELRNDPALLRRDEEEVRRNVNGWLALFGKKPITWLSDFYSHVDDVVLGTFPELDPYDGRQNGRYDGTWPEGAGHPVAWPEGAGQKVFAYLKALPGIELLLERLSKTGMPTVLYMSGVTPEFRDRYRSATLLIADRPVDLASAGRWCDVALVNATHGTTVAMLMAGRPVIMIPQYLEQRLIAERVERLGAGLRSSMDAQQVIERLEFALKTPAFSLAARRFAAKYADHDAKRQIQQVADRLQSLVQDSCSDPMT